MGVCDAEEVKKSWTSQQRQALVGQGGVRLTDCLSLCPKLVVMLVLAVLARRQKLGVNQRGLTGLLRSV